MKTFAMFPIIWIIVFSLTSIPEAIVVPKSKGTYEYVQTYRNNRDSKSQVENQVITTEVSCLVKFFRHLPSSNRIPLLIPTTNISRNTQYLLKEIQSQMPIFLLREGFKSLDFYDGVFSALLLLDDISVTEKVTSNLVYICSSNCVYVAIVTKFYENENEYKKEADILVHLLWKRKIANVLMIFLVRDSIQLAKSLFFKKNMAHEPSTPQFFGSCKETNGWEKEKSKIFSPLVLNDSIIQVAFFEDDPYIIISEDNQTFKGIEGDLLKVVIASLGLQMARDKISWTAETDILDEIELKLASNQSYDMVLGKLQWSPTFQIDYTSPYKV